MFNDYQDHLLDEQLRELFDEREDRDMCVDREEDFGPHFERDCDLSDDELDLRIADADLFRFHDHNDIHGDPEFRDSSDIVGAMTMGDIHRGRRVDDDGIPIPHLSPDDVG